MVAVIVTLCFQIASLNGHDDAFHCTCCTKYLRTPVLRLRLTRTHAGSLLAARSSYLHFMPTQKRSANRDFHVTAYKSRTLFITKGSSQSPALPRNRVEIAKRKILGEKPRDFKTKSVRLFQFGPLIHLKSLSYRLQSKAKSEINTPFPN